MVMGITTGNLLIKANDWREYNGQYVIHLGDTYYLSTGPKTARGWCIMVLKYGDTEYCCTAAINLEANSVQGALPLELKTLIVEKLKELDKTLS